MTPCNCISLSKVIKTDQAFNKTFFRAGKVFKKKDTSMNISFAARKFRPFFPTYFYNYISNDTINPQRDTIQIFFPNQHSNFLTLILIKNNQNEHTIAHFEYFFTCHYSRTVWLAENLNEIKNYSLWENLFSYQAKIFSFWERLGINNIFLSHWDYHYIHRDTSH